MRWGGLGCTPRVGRDRWRTMEDMDYWAAVVWSIAPTLIVSALFFFVLRSVIRADRTERKVYAKIEAEERAKRGMPAASDR